MYAGVITRGDSLVSREFRNLLGNVFTGFVRLIRFVPPGLPLRTAMSFVYWRRSDKLLCLLIVSRARPHFLRGASIFAMRNAKLYHNLSCINLLSCKAIVPLIAMPLSNSRVRDKGDLLLPIRQTADLKIVYFMK